MSGGFLKHGQTKKVYETLCSKTETSWKSKNINMHRFQKSSTSSQEMRNSKGIIRAKIKKLQLLKWKVRQPKRDVKIIKRKESSTFGFWFPSHFKAKTSFLLHVLAQEVARLCKIGLLLCLAVFQHVCLARKLSAILFSPQNNERKFCVTDVFLKILIWKA